MDIYRPQAPATTPATQAELDRLKALIERATMDGKITSTEMSQIKHQISADGLVAFEELELYRQLILDKIQQGLLEPDYE